MTGRRRVEPSFWILVQTRDGTAGAPNELFDSVETVVPLAPLRAWVQEGGRLLGVHAHFVSGDDCVVVGADQRSSELRFFSLQSLHFLQTNGPVVPGFG